MRRTITTLTAALALGAIASAQTININEIYISHIGTDDQEFLELKGTASMSLDFLMVLVVEGEDGSTLGQLKRAYPLTGYTMPVDGYFVLGDDAVTNLDMSVGATNTLENGTETFYLVDAADQPGVDAIVALVGTVVDLGGSVTSIPTMSTIIDIIGVVEQNYYTGLDQVYDGAVPLGPYGSFFPGGVFRGNDLNWCDTTWLDYDDDINLVQPRTPGTANGGCNVASCAWYCGGGGNMDTYTISTGFVLGGTYMGTVGFSAPNVGAVVAGYLGALTFPIWGQEGLVNVGTPEVMGLPSMIGVSPVTISWLVPADASYVGYHVFTQAAGFGGGAINLTCAFDCTAGY